MFGKTNERSQFVQNIQKTRGLMAFSSKKKHPGDILKTKRREGLGSGHVITCWVETALKSLNTFKDFLFHASYAKSGPSTLSMSFLLLYLSYMNCSSGW